MAKTNNIRKMYEINDIFSVVGYSLFFMGGLSAWSSLTIEAIAVTGIWDVITGLFNTDASGNLVALGLGVVAVLGEKYYKFGKFM
jgi:hypothetical protein